MHDSASADDSHEPETTGKKRLRATQACILCRKKKIKCDGTKPECLHCQEANLACEYSECRKRGPRKGYVQLLEERLAFLERRLTVLGDHSVHRMDLRGKNRLVSAKGVVTGGLVDKQEQDAAGSRDVNQAESSIPPPLDAGLYGDDVDLYPPRDVIMHLVDLFFMHINSVYPIIHRPSLIQSINNGTVSKPLLWSVLAIGARFSDHGKVKASPPYWAGERFYVKATSLINASMMEPTIPNLQFWSIMACLEYGRASGSRAWIYGGLAVRICQELGLNKEETLCTPILRPDGTVDAVAMALRRRILWSCICLDKYSSAGTGRPQYFDVADSDATLPTIAETILLRDPIQNVNSNGKPIKSDSLMDVSTHYLKMVLIFGEVNKFMSRAKSKSSTVTWPPVVEFVSLDNRLRAWKNELPDRFKFTPQNLAMHKENASQHYMDIWLSAHAVWCTSTMVLHRGSLAYTELGMSDVASDVYARIQTSIETCRLCIDDTMQVFQAMKDLCGFRVLPYMGYSAYIFSTVLMTSTFSKTPAGCKKSSAALRILYEMIDGLKPYWPMCERLALTTKDLLMTHARLYESQLCEPNTFVDERQQQQQQLENTSVLHAKHPTQTSALGYNSVEPYQDASFSVLSSGSSSSRVSYSAFDNAQPNIAMATLSPDTSPEPSSMLSSMAGLFQNSDNNGEIDFNSSEFLYDSAMFGQIILETSAKQGGTNSLDFSDIITPSLSSVSAPENNVALSQLWTSSPSVQFDNASTSWSTTP